MDALDDQDLVFFHLQHLTGKRLAGDEIEPRDLNGLTVDEPADAVPEQRDVQCVDRLKVIVAVFIPRRQHPVEEEIIHFDRDRGNAVGQQLDGKPFGGGGLSGRRRSGDHHDPDLIPVFCDRFRGFGELTVLQRLGNQDQVFNAALINGFVDGAEHVDVQVLLPASVFLEDRAHPFIFLQCSDLHVSAGDRMTQQELVFPSSIFQTEVFQIAGGGDHVAVKIILKIIQLVGHEVWFFAVIQQLAFVSLVLGLEKGFGFRQRDLFAGDGVVCRGQMPHFFLKLMSVFCHERPRSAHTAEDTAAVDGVHHLQIESGKEFFKTGCQHVNQRALVDDLSLGVGHGHRFHPHAGVDPVPQLPQFAVHDPGHQFRFQLGSQDLHKFFQRTAAGTLDQTAVRQFYLDHRRRFAKFKFSHHCPPSRDRESRYRSASRPAVR